jgi:predicted kinase
VKVRIEIPEASLVVLVGPSGSGKSSFARRHFRPTQMLSSDHYRGVVADDESDQTATVDAFQVVHYIARKRLAAGRLTVIDATSLRSEDRRPLLTMARTYRAVPVALVFDLPLELCLERNRVRPDRRVEPRVVRQHVELLQDSLPWLEREGFDVVHVMRTAEQVETAVVTLGPRSPGGQTDGGQPGGQVRL